MELKNHAEALSLYARLFKQFPDGGFWDEYSRAAIMSGNFDLAEQIWEKVRSVEPNTAELLSRLALEYLNIGLHAKGLALYFEAAKAEPGNQDAQLNLASLLARTSSVEIARAAVNRCLELDSRNEQARFLSAQLDRRENKLAEAERQVRDLIASDLRNPSVTCSCHHELAQILDRTGRFDEAMAELAEAKRPVQRTGNIEVDLKLFNAWHEKLLREAKSLPKNILQIWGKALPPRARTGSATLAFLGGPARSGATLFEKVLDAHPAVASCDESRAFPKILALIDITGPAIPAQRLQVLRERYLKNLTKTLGSPVEGKILLDKNPPPTPFLPAFLQAFPELRVLIALRDPRDVLVSLYFQNRAATNYLPIEKLAQHYSCLMDIWLAIREWEGLVWTEARYEDLVADLQKEGSRVTKFLGLQWHEDQARFYEKNREKPVMSGNYSDVTQPVYTRSVGRWRAYEKHLAPILPALEPYCKKFGYV